MACNCFNEIGEVATKQVVDKYQSSEFVDGSVDTKWTGGVFNFAKGDFAPVVLHVNVALRRKKKSGEPYAKKTNTELAVAIKFCPMCGTEFTGAEK